MCGAGSSAGDDKENEDPRRPVCGGDLDVGNLVDVFCETNKQWYKARIALADKG